MKFKDFLTEAKEDIVSLATDKTKDTAMTDKLRVMVQEKFNIKKMPPKIEAKDPETFVSEYNKILSTYGSSVKNIFDFNKNIGRGELLLACLSDDIIIGGTSQTYDVDFGKYKIEVKEVNFQKDNMNNFRLGKDSKAAMKIALDKIKYLFNISKYFYPELNTSEFNSKIEEGQELTKIIKFLRPVDITRLKGQEIVDVNINKKGRIYFQGNEFARIEDEDVVEKFKELISIGTNKIESFEEIEAELVRKLSTKKLGYFFFKTGAADLVYKKSLEGSVIDTITQGGIKLKVQY
jgi:hypothetical protein